MSKKQFIKRRFLFVEDGSVNVDELQDYIDKITCLFILLYIGKALRYLYSKNKE